MSHQQHKGSLVLTTESSNVQRTHTWTKKWRNEWIEKEVRGWREEGREKEGGGWRRKEEDGEGEAR